LHGQESCDRALGQRAQPDILKRRLDLSQLAPAAQHRGRMVRSDRQMPDKDARDFLRQQCLAHVGTSDASGWPYVVPLAYVYESGDLLYLHTGPHQGHFLANVGENPRICIQLNEAGPWQHGHPSPFDSNLVYRSVIAFGKVRVMEGAGVAEKKRWFIDRLLERLNDRNSTYENPYPVMLDRIILYEVELEIVTGKRNVGRH
jgi:nitroimidazol reductase NimA-like FMN-containing flavoprotein (pyridoxamine 5'-phosphate oxidase superfamily)